MVIKLKRCIQHGASVAHCFAITSTRRTNARYYILANKILLRMSILARLSVKEDAWVCACIHSRHNDTGCIVWALRKSWSNAVSLSLLRRKLHEPQIEARWHS